MPVLCEDISFNTLLLHYYLTSQKRTQVMGGGPRCEPRVPVWKGPFLCLETSPSFTNPPHQPLSATSQTLIPSLSGNHPTLSLGPLCLLGLRFPPTLSKHNTFENLEGYKFVEESKTILFVSQNIFIFRWINTN